MKQQLFKHPLQRLLYNHLGHTTKNIATLMKHIAKLSLLVIASTLLPISPASAEAKTGYAANDLTLFCNIDYAKSVAKAANQDEVQSIALEAHKNNCLFKTEAGSELVYDYIGKESDGIVLVMQINGDRDYYRIIHEKNIRPQEQLSSTSYNTTTPFYGSLHKDDDRSSSQSNTESGNSDELKVGYTENITFLYCEKYFQDRDIAFSGSGAIEAMEEAKKERGCEKMLGPNDKVNYRPTYLGNFYIVTYTDDNNQVYMNVLPTNYITPEE